MWRAPRPRSTFPIGGCRNQMRRASTAIATTPPVDQIERAQLAVASVRRLWGSLVAQSADRLGRRRFLDRDPARCVSPNYPKPIRRSNNSALQRTTQPLWFIRARPSTASATKFPRTAICIANRAEQCEIVWAPPGRPSARARPRDALSRKLVPPVSREPCKIAFHRRIWNNAGRPSVRVHEQNRVKPFEAGPRKFNSRRHDIDLAGVSPMGPHQTAGCPLAQRFFLRSHLLRARLLWRWSGAGPQDPQRRALVLATPIPAGTYFCPRATYVPSVSPSCLLFRKAS